MTGARWVVVLPLVLGIAGCSIESAGRGGLDGGPRADAGPRPDAIARDGRLIIDAPPPVDATVFDASPADVGFDAGPPVKLDTLRWELPCRALTGSSWLCETATRDEDDTTMLGAPGVIYDVTLRVRGVVEEKTIYGGVPAGRFHVGGDARSDDWTEAGLTVSDPGGTYWLNSGSSGANTCIGLDYEETISIRTGAVVTIWGATRNPYSNRNFDASGDPIVIDGVPPAPDAFDGQFIQVDAVAIEPP